MFIGTNYLTNEIKGSFWRPDDYMSRVPVKHVTGVEPAINVTLSAQGLNLASKLESDSVDYDVLKADSLEDEGSKISNVLFSSEDGTVSRYSFDIHTGEVNMVNIAV